MFVSKNGLDCSSYKKNYGSLVPYLQFYIERILLQYLKNVDKYYSLIFIWNIFIFLKNMGKGNDKEQLLIAEIIKGNDQTVAKLIEKYYSS